jgi:hypothetical protein
MEIVAIYRRNRRRTGEIVAIGLAAVLLLSACGFLEPQAPARSFALDDLFLPDDALPAGWKALEPVSLIGHDMCGECLTIAFDVPGYVDPALAAQEVFRYRSTGIAERTFQKEYMPIGACLDPVDEWTYESVIAEQQHFGCCLTAGNVRTVCEWGGQYEEYIVVFLADRDPPRLTLADMEQVVRAIDARMEQYLSQTSTSSE